MHFRTPRTVILREQNEVFSDLAAHTISVVGRRDGDKTRRVLAGMVSSNYFDTFGVPVTRGRGFLPEEEVPGGDDAVGGHQ